MARRKGWGDLSPAYRKRLSNAGISRSAYESGATIKRARGHAHTREHAGTPRHVRARGSVVEQWEVGHRENGEWYRSDLVKAINRAPTNKQGMLRLAITGEAVPEPEVRQYKGRVEVDEETGEERYELTVGAKISREDLLTLVDRNREGRYRVDMAAVAEQITGLPFISVESISIATGAPPQGRTR